MSGSELPRLIAPLALLLLPAMGCGVSDQGTTLPSGDEEANPTLVVEGAATPANLGDFVRSRAQSMALRSWVKPDETLPPTLDGLDYSAYQSLRFRPERALWKGATAFEVQLLPRGSVFRTPVRIHLAENGQVSEVPFDPALFTMEGSLADADEADRAALGYSGFRVHFPLNRPGVTDEVAVFQGASYFRLLGPGQAYGLSSRGLAIDLGGESGEEFPDFTDFWLVRPAPGDTSLVFHALLDSPSLTGAYRFELEPGSPDESTPTVLAVDARLFARRDVRKLGVAPFSSMYLYGPNDAGAYDDFRRQVHDSDGLMMFTGKGEWIWRPLSNRRGLHVTSLRDERPRGFGLAQRARDFDDYLDLEAMYNRRPSSWVVAEAGDWGTGGVELLEIPTVSEFADNIAAAWVPDAPFAAGDERHFQYRLVTFDRRLGVQTLAQVERTAIGWDALPGQFDPPPQSQRRFVIDFTDGPVDTAGEVAVAVLEASSGAISDLRTTPLPSGEGWRVSFRLVPDGNQLADMRLYLAVDDAPISETWSYVWYPAEIR